MRHPLVLSLQLAPALLLIGTVGGSPDSVRKCGGPQSPPLKPIVMIDGMFTKFGLETPPREYHLEPENVESIKILCMNPQDSTFTKGKGIGVVSIRFKNGPVTQARSALTAVLEAQDAYYRREAQYLADAGEVVLPEATFPLDVSLDVHDGGWVAKATFQHLLGACFVYDGDVPPPHPSVAPRTPECLNHRELAR